jgi:hypothetical protein
VQGLQQQGGGAIGTRGNRSESGCGHGVLVMAVGGGRLQVTPDSQLLSWQVVCECKRMESSTGGFLATESRQSLGM